MLLAATLRENICLGLPCAEDMLRRAIRDAVLDRDVQSFPQGLATVAGIRGVRLSGGQIQRTAVALVREPELLVFDDISSALEVETEPLLWQRLLARNVARVAVSHRPAARRQAHRITVLREGRVVGCGRLEELLHSCREMRGLWVAAGGSD